VKAQIANAIAATGSAFAILLRWQSRSGAIAIFLLLRAIDLHALAIHLHRIQIKFGSAAASDGRLGLAASPGPGARLLPSAAPSLTLLAKSGSETKWQ
jgi:hypothetical protein